MASRECLTVGGTVGRGSGLALRLGIRSGFVIRFG